MESASLKIIQQVRRDIASADIPYREYIAITRTLDILIEELTNGSQPSPSPSTPSQPR
jgi:hypothetical protein